jgi:hypothetical protein
MFKFVIIFIFFVSINNLGHTLVIIIDKKLKLQWCNFTLNDKESKISRTHAKNISKTKYLICVFYGCVYNFFHIVYIGGEHKAHVM